MAFYSARTYSPTISKTIGTTHMLLGLMALAIYISALMTGDGLSVISFGSLAVLAFFLSGFVQRLQQLTAKRFVWIFAAVDILLFTLIIWSFAGLYDGMVAAALKSPTYVFIFALIALQALRRDHQLLLFLGGVAIGARIVMFLVAVQSGAETTLSYTWYQNSPALMVAGEGELIIAIILFVVFLSAALKSGSSSRSLKDSEVQDPITYGRASFGRSRARKTRAAKACFRYGRRSFADESGPGDCRRGRG